MGGGSCEVGQVGLQVELLVNSKQDHDDGRRDPKTAFAAGSRGSRSKGEKRTRQIADDHEPCEQALVVNEPVHLYPRLASRCLRIRRHRIKSSTSPHATVSAIQSLTSLSRWSAGMACTSSMAAPKNERPAKS